MSGPQSQEAGSGAGQLSLAEVGRADGGGSGAGLVGGELQLQAAPRAYVEPRLTGLGALAAHGPS